MPKKKRDPWVNLHVHSMFSLLDGVGSYEDYADRVVLDKERRNDASQGYLAATEHGSMRGIVQLQKVAEKKDLQPIFGCEFYVSEDLHVKALDEADVELVKKQPADERRRFKAALEKYRGIRPRWHLTAWAMNETGLRNLMRLSSIGWIDGFFHRPRIDFPILEEYNEGIAIGTACLSGPLADPILRKEPAVAVENAGFLQDVFGDRLYIEVMANSLPDQDKVNRGMVKIAERLDIPLIATVDTHYVNPKDWRLQDTVLAVQTNDRMNNPNRWKVEAKDFWYKTGAEARQGFADHLPWLDEKTVRRAVLETAKLAGRCDARLAFDKFAALLPSPDGRDTTPAEDYAQLKELCVEGWHWRRVVERAKYVAGQRGVRLSRVVDEYKRRLAHELGVFRRLEFSRYALIVWDLVNYCRRNDIFVGPGRGSAAGSLAIYLLGITSIDPIEHGLLFERFIAPGRIDLPDIDLDIERERRQEVLAYLVKKYGRDRTSQISTYSSMKGRGCFRDVARVYGVPGHETDTVAKAILTRLMGHEREEFCIVDSLKTSPECKAFKKKRPTVFSVAQRLEGTIRHVSLHAGGIVAAPQPLIEIVPLESREDKEGGGGRVPVIAVDFRDAQELGLVKLDALGLKNLTAVHHALRAIKEHYKAAVTQEDLEDSHYNDKDVLKAFNDPTMLVGVFQFDSPTMASIMRFPVKRFEDLAALNALNRPGPMRSGLAAQYAARARQKAKGKLKIKKTHPVVDDITRDTFGVIVYQEQVTRLFVELAGFSKGGADKIRKKIGKSEGEKAIAPKQGKFVAGAIRRGLPGEAAAKLFKKLMKFGGYGFNKTVDSGTMVCDAFHGPKPIEEFRSGDTVLAMRPDGTARETEVVALHDHGVVPMWEVEFDDGTKERCTLDHKWGTYKGQVPLITILDQQLGVLGVDRRDLEEWRQGEALQIVRRRSADCESDVGASTPMQDASGAGALRAKCEARLVKSLRTHLRDSCSSYYPLVQVSDVQTAPEEDPARHSVENEQVGSDAPSVVRCSETYFGQARDQSCQGRGATSLERSQLREVCRDTAQGTGIAEAIEDGSVAGASVGAHRIPTEPPDTLRGRAKASGLHRPQAGRCDRSGRALALSSFERASVSGTSPIPGQDARQGSGSARVADTPSFDGELSEPHWGAETNPVSEAPAVDWPPWKPDRFVCRRIVRVDYLGLRQGYDLEVADPHHNFILASGLCCSNSHAAAYSALAYWEMLLKVRFPDAMFMGLLQAEDDLVKSARYVEAATRSGVEVLPPDVNESGNDFRLTHRNTIRPPLGGLKGVGPKASASLMAGQPYHSFADLVKRTDSRAVHAGVISVLAQAGALDGLVPNRRHIVENAKALAEGVRKKDAEAVQLEVDLSHSSPDFKKRERIRMAVEVGVFGPGHSPLDAYADLWEGLEDGPVELTKFTDINWGKEALVWCRAVARESKAVTTDDGRVGSMVLTDGSGLDLRGRMEKNELDKFERVVTKCQGKAILVRASLNPKAKSLRVLRVFDAATLHKNWRAKELTPEEAKIWQHPLKGVKPRHNLRRAIETDPELLSFVGRIEAVKLWKDRKKKTMAFFDVQAWRGSVPVVCFGSSYPTFRNAIYVGAVVKVEVLRGDSGWVLDSESGCTLKDLGY